MDNISSSVTEDLVPDGKEWERLKSREVLSVVFGNHEAPVSAGPHTWEGSVERGCFCLFMGSLLCLDPSSLLWSECPLGLGWPWPTSPFLLPRDTEVSSHVALRLHPSLHSGLSSLFSWMLLVNGGCYHLCKMSSSQRVTSDGSCPTEQSTDIC